MAVAWQPQLGATLLIPSGLQGQHLFVVLNDPKIFQGYGPRAQVLLVNLSSIRPGTPHDSTCVLQPGCHTFVQQPSYVAYRYARIYPAEDLVQRVKEGLFHPNDPMPALIVEQIRHGLITSPFTKREFKIMAI